MMITVFFITTVFITTTIYIVLVGAEITDRMAKGTSA